MKWMLKYLKPLRLRLTIGISIKFVATTVELLIPFLLSYILENVIVTNDVGNILFFGSLMAICALVTCIGNITANRMAAKTAMLFSRRMRRDLFEKTLNLSAKSTDKFTIPSLEARITSDTYNVQNFVTIMQKMGIRAPILLIGGTAITMIMDVKLALVMLATLPLIFVIIYSISRMGIPLYSKVHHSVDGMIRIVREDAQGIRVIKALSKIDYEKERDARGRDHGCGKPHYDSAYEYGYRCGNRRKRAFRIQGQLVSHHSYRVYAVFHSDIHGDDVTLATLCNVHALCRFRSPHIIGNE